MSVSTVFLAFALMLIIEGALPLLAPTAWRETFRRLLSLSNGQIRFIGLLSVVIGAIILVAVF